MPYTTDSFNRTNSTSSLGTTDGSGTLDPLTWVQQQGTLGISSNEAYASALSSSRAIATVETSQANIDASLKLTTVSSNAAALLFRFSDTSNFWLAYATGTQLFLYKVVAGGFDSPSGSISGFADGHTVRIVANGSAIELFDNGVSKYSTTDSHNSTATKHGFYIGSSTAVRVDDFSASAVSGGDQTVTAQLLDNSVVFYQPTVTRATTDVTVATSLLINNVILYEPDVEILGVQTAVASLLTLTVSLFEPTVGRHTAPTGLTNDYAVYITDMWGNVGTDVSLAMPRRITRTLNEPDEATFSFPKPAYTAAQIPVLGTASGVREVQIYRDGDLLFWGPIIQADTAGNTGAVDCNCAGVDWYMNRRAIDGARTNLLANPSFEDGLNGWEVTSLPGFSVAASTTRKVLGDYSLAMFNGTPGAESHIHQAFFHPSTTIGNLLTLSAWYFIEAMIAPAIGRRGAYIEFYDEYGDMVDYDYVPIDEGSPVGEWTRGEIELWIPPGGALIDVRLYSPHGAIYWDAVQLVAMESVSTAGISGSPTTEVDVVQIIPMLVGHVQNAAVGKSDLNVGWGLSGGNTGVTMAKHYQYADHVAFDQAVGEFIDRDDCGDIAVDITPHTRTYTLSTPRRSVDRFATVWLVFGSTIADYRFVADGAGTITRATVLGQGDGPDREEGEYADASAVGGLILQDIRTAPAKTTINSLLPLASDVVYRHGRPERVIEIDVLPTANIIHTVTTGDVIAVTINDGYVNIEGPFRVVGWDLDCETDVLTLTLNEE